MSEHGDSRSGRPLSFWIELALVALASIAVQLLQVHHYGLGNDADGAIYLRYAMDWGGGAAPYRDFMPEYPPGAMVLAIIPYLLAGSEMEHYRLMLAVEMGLFDLAAVLVVLVTTWRLWPSSRLRRLLAIVLYIAATLALSRLVHRRLDMAVATLALAGLVGRPFAGGVWLGLAAAAKLWPLALLPIRMIAAFKTGGPRAALGPALGFGLGLMIVTLPFLPRAHDGVLRFFDYHVQRGVQVESSWALAAFVLDSLEVAPARCTWEHGADHVAGPATEWMRSVSTPVTGGLAALPLLVLLLRRRERAATLGLQIRTGAAVVAGLLLGGKVLSPQFFIWLAPLVALGVLDRRRGWAALGVLLAAALPVLTSLVYLVYYTPLCEGNREVAIPVALARFACLIGLYVLMLTGRGASETAPRPDVDTVYSSARK